MRVIGMIAAGLLLLTGITAVPAGAVQSSYSSDELGFASSIRENSDALGFLSTHKLVDLGNNTCQALRNGRSVHKLADIYLTSGVDEFDVGLVIGASVSWLCPKYTKAVKRYIASLP